MFTPDKKASPLEGDGILIYAAFLVVITRDKDP